MAKVELSERPGFPRTPNCSDSPITTTTTTAIVLSLFLTRYLDIDIMSPQLDAIDRIATNAFEGYVVRKDLVRRVFNIPPIPQIIFIQF